VELNVNYYRFVKKKVRASQCFKSFHAAERTLEGIESVNMMRKGQVKRLLEVMR
jgi:transposase-like protein